MEATALNNDENSDALRDLLYIIQNNVYQEAERSLGQYRLQAFKTDYSATEMYYSVHKKNWIDSHGISKKTIQISLELIGYGNDTKPVIMVEVS